MLLTTAYFPPAEYFALLAKYSVVNIEAHEKYQKQSYRNRCRILTANGVEDLRFPIVHGGSPLITDVEVDYKTPWVRQTEYAIDSAYFSSPFFEYYRDSLFEILDSSPRTLWELNGRLTDYFCSKIGIAPSLVPTESFAAPGEVPAGEDFRYSIHPKKPAVMRGPEYWQVFRERFGFVPGMSVMDLLFNEGPESLGYLLAYNLVADGGHQD